MAQSNAAPIERLGRYEILGEIASGGMATVFLGRVTGAKGFQRLVAIKRLHPHLENEEEFVSMFLDEARLAARIRHQNVVATLDVEDQAGLYIVMEYVEGDRLLSLLRHAAKTGERIPPPIALRIALDTLAGMHAAHELSDDDGQPVGLVHRDISPQNILIGLDGVSRLTDFGIAKAASRLTVTRDGQLKGKIAYMAPEQTKRVEIDRRVDLFAMGIITWEMLTTKKLFLGESDVEVLNQLLFEPIPRLRDHAPNVPAALDAAVMRALEREPSKRYATAAEFADTLERAAKVMGGAANARTVAQYIQRVSADKIARDRARASNGSVPLGRMTGEHPVVDAGSVSVATRKSTLVGVGSSAMKAPTPAAMPPKSMLTRPAASMADMSLVDDDEDVPTAALMRPTGPSDEIGDEEATMVGRVSPAIKAQVAASTAAVRPLGASVPTAAVAPSKANAANVVAPPRVAPPPAAKAPPTAKAPPPAPQRPAPPPQRMPDPDPLDEATTALPSRGRNVPAVPVAAKASPPPPAFVQEGEGATIIDPGAGQRALAAIAAGSVPAAPTAVTSKLPVIPAPPPRPIATSVAVPPPPVPSAPVATPRDAGANWKVPALVAGLVIVVGGGGLVAWKMASSKPQTPVVAAQTPPTPAPRVEGNGTSTPQPEVHTPVVVPVVDASVATSVAVHAVVDAGAVVVPVATPDAGSAVANVATVQDAGSAPSEVSQPNNVQPTVTAVADAGTTTTPRSNPTVRTTGSSTSGTHTHTTSTGGGGGTRPPKPPTIEPDPY